jgi:hypothetical protein
MPPEAMTPRSSNCRSLTVIMTGPPHLLQGCVSKGGRSLGMKFFALHRPHDTIFNDFLPSLIPLVFRPQVSIGAD